MSIEPTTDDATKRLLDENIQRTVAAATLRRMRGFVDQVEAEDRAARRFSRIMLVCVGAVLALLVVAFLTFGLGRLTRWLVPSATPRADAPSLNHPMSSIARLGKHP